MNLATVQTSYRAGYSYESYSAGRSGRSNGSTFDLGKATRKATAEGDGKNIGLMTIGNTCYAAQYSEKSTPDNPIIKVGDYEVSVNDVDPENATELEMFALMTHMDKTGQSHNTGICSYTKMKIYNQIAESNGSTEKFLEGFHRDENAVCNKKSNWLTSAKTAYDIFMGNPQTYGQAIKCQDLISALQEFIKSKVDNMNTQMFGDSMFGSTGFGSSFFGGSILGGLF